MLESTDPLKDAEKVLDLVTRRAFLKNETASMEAELKSINSELVMLGEGEYFGRNGERTLVVAPAASIQPPKDKAVVTQLKETIGDEAVFKKLFWFFPVYKPVKEFRAVATALLTPGKLKAVLAIMEKRGTRYVA